MSKLSPAAQEKLIAVHKFFKNNGRDSEVVRNQHLKLGFYTDLIMNGDLSIDVYGPYPDEILCALKERFPDQCIKSVGIDRTY